jgi:hypothetical protein
LAGASLSALVRAFGPRLGGGRNTEAAGIRPCYGQGGQSPLAGADIGPEGVGVPNVDVTKSVRRAAHKPVPKPLPLVAALAAVMASAACSTLFGADPIGRAEVERNIQVDLFVRGLFAGVVCPADLEREVGATMTCSVTVSGRQNPFDSTQKIPLESGPITQDFIVTVDAVEGGDAHYAWKSADEDE